MGLDVLDVKPLMKLVGERFGACTFVEGGTFAGATARWASDHFEKVITIEADESLYSAARKSLADRPNVTCVFGKTVKVLPGVLAALDGPAVFWLDSHWSGPGTFGEGNECPVIEEIRLINAAAGEHYLFIDDARFLLAPPLKPAKIDQWPTIDEVMAALTAVSPKPYVLVYADAVIAVPPRARALVADHCQATATAHAYRTQWRRVCDSMARLRTDFWRWLTYRQQYDPEGRPL